MAWGGTSGVAVGIADKTAGTSIVSSAFDANVTVGSVCIVVVAKNNAATADGETSEVTSVTDTKGNTYTKLKEFCNSQGAADAGATVSVWYSQVATQLTTSDTCTANFSASTAASAIMARGFTATSGATITMEGSATLANDGADPGSMTLSGLASREYLFIRAIAYEGVVTTGTNTTDYVPVAATAATSGGGGASNMGVWAEWRIFTGTGDTSNPTVSAVDSASVYVAIKEAASGARTLTCASGSYSISGTANALVRSRILVSASGSYSISGTAATLIKGNPLTAASGSYTITGMAAAFKRAYVLAGASGSYAISGTAATLTVGGTSTILAAGSGSYSITGTAASLLQGYKFAAGSGTYAISGTAAALIRTRLLVAASGSYAVSGTAAAFLRPRYLAANTGSYSVSGTAAALLRARVLVAASGSYAITGTAAALSRGYRLTASSGSYAITGTAADFWYIWIPVSPVSASWGGISPTSGLWTPTTPTIGSWS